MGEIEEMTRAYQVSIAWSVVVILACIFTLAWGHYAWSIILWTITTVVGLFFNKGVEKITEGVHKFLHKQEMITKIALFCLGIIISIFLAPAIFALLGFGSGTALVYGCCGECNHAPKETEEKKEDHPFNHPEESHHDDHSNDDDDDNHFDIGGGDQKG